MAEKVYQVGELFAGAGGLGLAAHLAHVEDRHGNTYRCRAAWANDWNEWALQTYARNLGGQTICCPVQDLPMAELAPIDGLMFGFPCNDFSVVGEQRGLAGEYGPLYTYGVKVLRTHRPQWFLAENVSGLETANDGHAFRQILLAMEGAGYRLTPHLYEFEQYGVPQTRHRIIVVGIRDDFEAQFQVPAPTTPSRPVTVREAFEGVEAVSANNKRVRHSPSTVVFLSHIPPGENAWYEGIPEPLRLKMKGARLSHIYRRLHADRPAHTVTARGGGGTRGYHWAEARALTNRELARIQTFPDDYIFEGSAPEVRSQIGMAVPPHGAQVIIEAILKTQAGVPYDWVPASLQALQMRFELE